MIVVFQTKRGLHGINVNKILHAYPYFSGVRIELEDGTYVDVQASIEEVCTICNRTFPVENLKK